MLEDSYLKLPYDLSGSMSKNRFRNEMLWGLEKMFELYKTNQDFFMVFDYVCDIEAHLDGKIEFFQIKTNNAAKPYSITKIAKPDKSGKSILGKLYAIKTADDSEDGIVSKLAIVVNVPLKTSDNVTHSTDREISFDKIDEVSKRKIAEYLIKECNVQTVDLSDCYYLYTSMDLFNPHDSLLGKTINFFVDVYGEEPKRAKVLFQTMTDTIEMKACYEQRCINYDEVILKKGISRNELQKILEKHIDISDESIQIVKQEIKEIYPEFSVCTKMNAALVAVTKELRTNKVLIKIEQSIVKYILGNLELFDGEIVDNSYTVTFMVDGNVYQEVREVKGTEVSVTDPVKAETETTTYEFTGWTLEDGSKVNVADLNDSTVVYASFDEKEKETEPTEPVGPTGPTEPTQPTEPTEPTEPTQPTEPSQPTEPTKPAESTQPAESTEPAQPANPTQPASSETAVTPADNNTQPETAAQTPVTPAQTPVTQAQVAQTPVRQQQAAQQPQDAEEPVVLEDEEVPLANITDDNAKQEVTALEDEAVPLAANPAGEDNCIIHWIMMILTIVFAGYNVVRAVLRQKKNA